MRSLILLGLNCKKMKKFIDILEVCILQITYMLVMTYILKVHILHTVISYKCILKQVLKSLVWRFNIIRFFLEYGLIFEVVNDEITSFENLLKADEIKKVSDKICYNDGQCDLSATSLKNYTKIKRFFNSFSYVFTTNYDLILDDICKCKTVYHLYGSFNIVKKRENGKSHCEKLKYKVDYNEAYLILGIHGEEKVRNMKAGLTLPIRLSVTFLSSIFDQYLDKLQNGDYDELHVFGYSG